ncbi:retrovirus-related Pol polyprotein from transposon 412 [Trichonephila clavipes]|nr:retrovirus-related Pol polyprotein from transposon 412 [Trichonephila clavipes]
MADLKDLKGALVFAMKFEAAQQATRKDRHPIRAVNESDTSNSSVERLERQMRSFMNRVESLMSQKADGKKTLKCWTCGREGHLQRSCRARQGAETNKRLPEGGVGKLINDHRGTEVARFWKAPLSSVSNFVKEYRTEIIVPGYIGNDVSFNSGLIGTAENKANGLLIASTLVDLSRKTIPKSSAERLFQEFEDVFSRNSSDIGHTTVTQHRIDTADHPPIKQHPRRLPFAKQEEVGTLLREMQENDIIEPSSSPWASQSSWFVRKMAPQDFAWTIENLTTSPRRTATLFQG